MPPRIVSRGGRLAHFGSIVEAERRRSGRSFRREHRNAVSILSRWRAKPTVGRLVDRGVRPRVQVLRPGKFAQSPDVLRTRRRSLQVSAVCCTSRRCGPATRRLTFCARDLPAQMLREMAVGSGDRVMHRRQRYFVPHSTFRKNHSNCRAGILHVPSMEGLRLIGSCPYCLGPD